MLSFSEIILHLLGSCERSSPAFCVGHFSVVMKRKSSGTAVGLKMDNISGVERKEEENNSPQPMQIVNELPRRVFSAIISKSDWTIVSDALHAITKAHIQWKLRRKCDEARWKIGKVVKAFRYRRMFPVLPPIQLWRLRKSYHSVCTISRSAAPQIGFSRKGKRHIS